MMYMKLFILSIISSCVWMPSEGNSKYATDEENTPYEFGFTIDGQQHRHEKKDANGIIQGEFGFITADGVYHVTVYATDENGDFRILSMRNVRISKPLDELNAQLPDTSQFAKSSPNVPAHPASPNPLSITTRATTRENYQFTTQSTIKPGCAGCGVVTHQTPVEMKHPLEMSVRGEELKPQTEVIGTNVEKSNSDAPFVSEEKFQGSFEPNFHPDSIDDPRAIEDNPRNRDGVQLNYHELENSDGSGNHGGNENYRSQSNENQSNDRGQEREYYGSQDNIHYPELSNQGLQNTGNFNNNYDPPPAGVVYQNLSKPSIDNISQSRDYEQNYRSKQQYETPQFGINYPQPEENGPQEQNPSPHFLDANLQSQYNDEQYRSQQQNQTRYFEDENTKKHSNEQNYETQQQNQTPHVEDQNSQKHRNEQNYGLQQQNQAPLIEHDKNTQKEDNGQNYDHQPELQNSKIAGFPSQDALLNPLSISEPNYNPNPVGPGGITVSDGVIHIPNNAPITIQDKYPNMVDGLPKDISQKDITDLLYKFNYTIGFHGHYEKGYRNGAKVGGYFVTGRDGVSQVVTYVADENGFRPKVKLIRLDLNSDLVPKEGTEKNFGLKNFEFIWYPLN